jgi:hypothetical protein
MILGTDPSTKRETDLISDIEGNRMIFHIKIRCLDCGEVSGVLVEARDLGQLHRISATVAYQHAEVELMYQIERVEPTGDPHVDFSPLALPWLRATPSGWKVYPPRSRRGLESHSRFLENEYRANLQGK